MPQRIIATSCDSHMLLFQMCLTVKISEECFFRSYDWMALYERMQHRVIKTKSTQREVNSFEVFTSHSNKWQEAADSAIGTVALAQEKVHSRVGKHSCQMETHSTCQCSSCTCFCSSITLLWLCYLKKWLPYRCRQVLCIKIPFTWFCFFKIISFSRPANLNSDATGGAPFRQSVGIAIELFHHPSHRLYCTSGTCYTSHKLKTTQMEVRIKLHPTDEACVTMRGMPAQARTGQGSNVASEKPVLETKRLLRSRPQLHQVEKWLTRIHMQPSLLPYKQEF